MKSACMHLKVWNTALNGKEYMVLRRILKSLKKKCSAYVHDAEKRHGTMVKYTVYTIQKFE